MKLFKKRQPYAEKDYTVNMLPHTRKEVFFDTLKLQWRGLILLGLIVLLFSIPIHILDIFNAIENSKLNYESVGGGVETIYQMISMSNIMVLIKVPCYLLLFVGLAGVCRIIRQYAYGENVFFMADFFQGIKQNGAQMFLLGLVFSIMYALSMVAFNFSRTIDNIWLALLCMLPLGLFVLIVIPVTAYSVVSITVYKNKFGNILLTSLMNVAKAPFKTFVALLCCLGILALQLIPNLIAMFVVKAVFSAIAPLSLLGWFLFALNRFDKTINAEKYPELVGRGTYPVEEDEEDIDLHKKEVDDEQENSKRRRCK